MKQQVQESGIRKWFGDDFINMQNEVYEAMNAITHEYGNYILSGATVTNNGNGTFTIADGIVMIKDSNGQNAKYCRVYSQTIAAGNWPIYLVQATKDKTQVPAYGRVYKDANTKNIIVEHYAALQTTQPAHSQYIVVQSSGAGTRFRDALQSASYRFVTDTEKNTWNGKYGTAAAVLAALLTVDGSGSALDADKIDGFHFRLNGSIMQYSTDGNTWTDISMTAASILAALLTVDGSGSGLDADKLDGNEATAFQLAADMVSANTANKGVKRDSSGNFTAGTITVTDIIIS